MPAVVITLIIIAGVILLLSLFFSYVPVGLWIKALASSVHVRPFPVTGLRIRPGPL